jgi:type VI secretion system protein VasI
MRLATFITLSVVLLGSSLVPQLAKASQDKAEKVPDSDLLVRQANQCRDVNERLERLRCFDRVFSTPVEDEKVVLKKHMPASWERAMTSATKADANTLMSLSFEGTKDSMDGDAWLTLTANNGRTRFPDSAKPVLMMSCIDRLSRIELVLPDEIPDARVKISLVGGSAQYWRSDDTGYLLASSRGMPAIAMMKKMSSERRSVLRSNSKFIDGLTFNTESLPSAIKVLRQRCRW